MPIIAGLAAVALGTAASFFVLNLVGRGINFARAGVINAIVSALAAVLIFPLMRRFV